MFKLIKKEGSARRGEYTTPHGVVQTPLRGHNEHLHPRWYRAIGDKHPINAEWVGHKFARRLVEARNNTAVAESFCLMECIGSQKETY